MARHVTIHAHPGGVLDTSDYTTLDGHRLRQLNLASERLIRPLSVTFEQALSRLEQLPRLYIEPDGSFIWIGPHGPDEWKFDGQLHDSMLGLLTIELKIDGRRPALNDVLTCLDWPRESFVFQLVREGIYVDDATLLELLS